VVVDVTVVDVVVVVSDAATVMVAVDKRG